MTEILSAVSYAGRRSSIRGWAGLFRGVIRCEDGTEILLMSPAVAHALAEVFETPLRQTENTYGAPGIDVPIPRYVASHFSAKDGTTRVEAGEGGPFGVGPVASCPTPELAKRVAALLNQIDPATLKPRRRGHGIGWW